MRKRKRILRKDPSKKNNITQKKNEENGVYQGGQYDTKDIADYLFIILHNLIPPYSELI